MKRSLYAIVAVLLLATKAIESFIQRRKCFLPQMPRHHYFDKHLNRLEFHAKERRNDHYKARGLCMSQQEPGISRKDFLSFVGTSCVCVVAAKATACNASIKESFTPSIITTASEGNSVSEGRKALEESVSGFVAGAGLSASKTIIKYPLDTATVRLQMPDTQYSIWRLVELFDGSFRGISGSLISNVPAGAVFFSAKDAVKSTLQGSGLPKWVTTTIAVALAQPPYWVVRNPSEVVKTRQQAGIEGYGDGVSTIDAFKMASQGENGIQSFYTGYGENLIYALPADLIKFICYEALSKGDKNLNPLEGAAYGAASTAIAQLATTPLDVVRNRIMAEKSQESSSYVDNFVDIAKTEGVVGLFAGATPRFGKALLSGAVQFAAYEETKQTIGRFFDRRR